MAMRQTMVDMVLATEMTRHFEHLNKFVGVIVNFREEQPGTPVDVSCQFIQVVVIGRTDKMICKLGE